MRTTTKVGVAWGVSVVLYSWVLSTAARGAEAVPRLPPAGAALGAQPVVQYVGSAACASCHKELYLRWQKTPMANVVRDPKAHPEAILPDLSKPDPLVTFKKDDIALVYGSLWKQRYFTKVGSDYYVEPAQWDVTNRLWRPYFVANGTDWWTSVYPPDNMKRPTGPLCDGCHSVNYDVRNKSVTEWNVGCESCHGPGGAHAQHPARSNIKNPARMSSIEATDICIQCHSQGQPLRNPIAGNYYDWPVGFRPGLRLADYWELEGHQLGETSFTHFPDGTAHKNRMQGNDFVQSLMYRRGVSCHSCHDVHGTKNPAQLRSAVAELCLECHEAGSRIGPRAPTLAAHTHHRAGTPGSQCVDCHMPPIEVTIANVYVRAHTFAFVTPGMTEQYKIPNPCTGCHKDKSTGWAQNQLSHWPERSPWRAR